MTDYDPGVEPFPFATVEELRRRWKGGMPDNLEDAAEVALEDASQFILDLVPQSAERSAHTRMMVTCAVVEQALRPPDALDGMESVQQGAGPFQQTLRPANPYGGFFLTTTQRNQLLGDKQKAFEVDPLEGSRRAHEGYRGL